MTRENAIKMLEYIRHTGNGESEYKNDAQAIAIDMAIQELEQEPCEDAISREAVKEKLRETWVKYVPMELDINLSFVLEKISELPSVTPLPRTMIEPQGGEGGTIMRYGVIRGIVEAGNCVYCGKHIEDGGHVFLCADCRRKEVDNG